MEKLSEPINNIYWIPVNAIQRMLCQDGGQIQGYQQTRFLSEGDSPGEAKIALRQSLAFADNYNDLPDEKRKGILPFRFREGKIEQVLCCEHRFKNKNGNYTCGRPHHDVEGHPDQHDTTINMNGEYGMCCIEQFSVPEGIGCPYEKKMPLF